MPRCPPAPAPGASPGWDGSSALLGLPELGETEKPEKRPACQRSQTPAHKASSGVWSHLRPGGNFLYPFIGTALHQGLPGSLVPFHLVFPVSMGGWYHWRFVDDNTEVQIDGIQSHPLVRADLVGVTGARAVCTGLPLSPGAWPGTAQGGTGQNAAIRAPTLKAWSNLSSLLWGMAVGSLGAGQGESVFLEPLELFPPRSGVLALAGAVSCLDPKQGY